MVNTQGMRIAIRQEIGMCVHLEHVVLECEVV